MCTTMHSANLSTYCTDIFQWIMHWVISHSYCTVQCIFNKVYIAVHIAHRQHCSRNYTVHITGYIHDSAHFGACCIVQFSPNIIKWTLVIIFNTIHIGVHIKKYTSQYNLHSLCHKANIAFRITQCTLQSTLHSARWSRHHKVHITVTHCILQWIK